MDIKDLMTYLDLQLMELEDGGKDLNTKSWGMQEGIILSGKEVKTIVDNYREQANKSDSESANCAIFDASHERELLVDFKNKLIEWQYADYISNEAVEYYIENNQ